ncbi:unnamed protein product [Lampetra planeri]
MPASVSHPKEASPIIAGLDELVAADGVDGTSAGSLASRAQSRQERVGCHPRCSAVAHPAIKYKHAHVCLDFTSF